MAVKKFVSVGPVGDARVSGITDGPSRVGLCASMRVGLLAPVFDRCTGKEIEKRFVRTVALEDVDSAIDEALP